MLVVESLAWLYLVVPEIEIVPALMSWPGGNQIPALAVVAVPVNEPEAEKAPVPARTTNTLELTVVPS
jgi:hypothetical protein